MGKLLDIIDKHDCYGCENFSLKEADGTPLQDNRLSDDQIVADVKALMLELIGPDEPISAASNPAVRNQLRHALRAKIAVL